MIDFLPPERNFLALPPEHSRETSRVMVLPVPFEATSTFGHGSSEGPQAVLDASHELELYDSVLGKEAFLSVGGIATLRPLDVAACDGAALCGRLEAAAAALLAQKKSLVVLGGEHTSVLGSIRAHCRACPDLTVLQLDAHSDLRAEYLGSAWNHACAASRVLDVHDALVQVGIRSQCTEDRRVIEERAIRVFYAHDIHRMHEIGEDWVRKILDELPSNVYVTLDCDVFDPSVIPATGTPEPDGLTWQQVDRLFAALCRERRLVGFDLCELAPVPMAHYPQFTAAKLVYRIIGYAFENPQ